MARPPVPGRARSRLLDHLLIFGTLLAILIATHLHYLSLGYFWDELGQFVPAALDILRDNAWVPHSTIPNVHPPGVMAYLALCWKLAGYSEPVTRLAMLVIAALGLHASFLLAIRMCRDVPGAPAFAVVALLLATPLVYTQAMMAQLDLPAMSFTICGLWLFLEKKYRWAAFVCTLLVLVKETGLLLPALFGFWLLFIEKRTREALYFVAPAIALGIWLVVLKRSTGEWLGDPGFEHYNVGYALSPIRASAAILRRIWYLLFADLRWIGTLAIAWALRRSSYFRTREWGLLAGFSAAHVLLVSLLGGATLERYVLPVLPVVYLAAMTGIAMLRTRIRRLAFITMTAGLIAGLFWHPPYPYPFENDLGMTNFVELQKVASQFVEREARGRTVASAWPYTGGWYSPSLGYVRRPLRVAETTDFNADNVIRAVRDSGASLLVVYTRTWNPGISLLHIRRVEEFLSRYWGYEQPIGRDRIRSELGMVELVRFEQGGQFAEVYVVR